MPKVFDCEQHDAEGNPTREWIEARLGRITASRFGDIMAYSKAKGKEGVELICRMDYRMELIAERLTGQFARHYVTPEMQWGAQMEDRARGVYETKYEVLVQPVGFCLHPTMDFSGASPDGWVGENKIIEIKCPTTARYLDWRKTREVPQEYIDQILWNMVCGERTEADFIGYDPRLPENLQLLVIPVQYDEKRVAELEAEVRKMEAEIQAEIASLT